MFKQCITELERYSAKGFVGKPEKNKGAKKQEAWVESLQELVDKPSLDQQTRQILKRIASQSNVPRKKPKFINFLNNCMRIDPKRSGAIWSIIEVNLDDFNKRLSVEQAQQQTQNQTSTSDSVSNGSSETNGTSSESSNGTSNGSTNGSNGIHHEENDNSSSQWNDILAHALNQPSLASPARKTLKKLQKLIDIPDNAVALKKKKFVKFVQQQLEIDTDVAKSVWHAFDESRAVIVYHIDVNDLPSKSPKKRKHSENAAVEVADTSIKDKKKKTSGGCLKGVDTNGNADGNEICDLNNSTFDWEKNISKVFKKHKQQNELDLAFLKSKVLKKYSKENEAANASLSHIEKKITKVIKKIDKFVVEDDIVKLRD